MLLVCGAMREAQLQRCEHKHRDSITVTDTAPTGPASRCLDTPVGTWTEPPPNQHRRHAADRQ
jgi:hypothetical protein